MEVSTVMAIVGVLMVVVPGVLGIIYLMLQAAKTTWNNIKNQKFGAAMKEAGFLAFIVGCLLIFAASLLKGIGV